MEVSTIISAIRVRHSTSRNLYYDPSLSKKLVHTLWEQPEALISQGHALRSKAVRRTALVEWDHERYVLKHYIEPTWWHAFKHSFSRSRGWRAWANACRLAAANVLTPYPVACLETPIGHLRSDSFFMYRYEAGETLESYYQTEPNVQAVNAVIKQLRRIWDRLRAVQMSLTDTHVRNFIVTPDHQICVIDVDDVRVHRSPLLTAHYQLRSWQRLMRSIPAAFCRAA